MDVDGRGWTDRHGWPDGSARSVVLFLYVMTLHVCVLCIKGES